MKSRGFSAMLVAAGLAVGCPSVRVERRAARPHPPIEAVAEHYRRHHDFESLEILLGVLHIGMPRARVEELLGEPTHCPLDEAQCYYPSDRRNAAGLPLTLVVEYGVRHRDDRPSKVTDRLESLYWGPVEE